MDADPARSVVIGALQERHPEASIYNRLCALEWKSPPGDLRNFGALGGIMLVRATVFSRLGGFNVQVIAGEDSEFGVRVGVAGQKITKIAMAMATHDADIHRFGQWWRRAVRAGHAIGQRFRLNGRGPLRDCARERRSVLVWGVSLPLLIVGLAPFTNGASLLLAGGYLLLGHAESLIQLSNAFELRHLRGDMVYRKPLPGAEISDPWHAAARAALHATGDEVLP